MTIRTRDGWCWSLAALMLVSLVWPATADARRRRQPVTGDLAIEALTIGAKVYIDGKLIGKTPFDKPVKLKPGKHKLKATKFGFSSLELDFSIRARRKTDLMVDLVPYSGLVKFTANIKGAEVYVDGKLLGHTPLIKTVGIGDHKVMLVQEGYNDFSAKLNVKAGEKHFVDGVMTPFQDFSPEVLAIKKAQEEEAQRKKDEAARIELAAAQPAPVPVTPWYDQFYEKWWFWTAVGAVVVTAVAVPVATSTGGGQSGLKAHDSPIDPIRLP